MVMLHAPVRSELEVVNHIAAITMRGHSPKIVQDTLRECCEL